LTTKDGVMALECESTGGNMPHDLTTGQDPSSTSWGSQVRVLHRPLPVNSTSTITAGESNESYHSSTGWSKSQLWDHASRGSQYFYLRHVAKSIRPEESAALTHGTLLHRWMEVGDAFFSEVVCAPDEMLTETGLIGKKARQWATENAPEQALISSKELRQIQREVAAIKGHRAAMDLIESAVAHELSIRWRSSEDDLLRCRPDLCTEDRWVDLKTTREMDILSSFWKSVMDYGYHAQDAHYQWGMEAVGMEPRPLCFVVVSTASPHQCHVVTLPLELVSEGRKILLRTLADIRVRMDLDYWMPDQHGEVVELPIPAHVLGRIA